MQQKANYWEQFYIENTPDKIPWTGESEKFFSNIWEKYELPEEGNLLDVGSGRGDKAIFLADNYDFRVWAFDISQTAIKVAKDSSKTMNNPPVFFVSDAKDLQDADEIKGVKFNIIVDLVTTQFLSKVEEQSYLKELRSHLVPHETFYVLNTFVKDSNNDLMRGYPDWVVKIAQSPEMMNETYFRYFSVEDEWVRLTPKGKVGTFIMIAK